jgi:hypothetical protein
MERRAMKSFLVLSCLLVLPLVSSVAMPSEFRPVATRHQLPFMALADFAVRAFARLQETCAWGASSRTRRL